MNASMGIKFSREFSAKCRAKQYFGRSKRSNSRENLAVSSLQSSPKRIIQEEFGRHNHHNHTRGTNGTTTCHPSVTLVTLQKGCRRPVHRRSVTLTPFFLKNSILLSYSSSGFLPTPPPSPSTATKKGMSGDYWESPLRQQPEGKELVIDFVDAEG